MDFEIFHHILLLLGIAIFFGLTGGRIFKKLKIPQVVGYIIIGVILGQSVLKFYDASTLVQLRPFTSFALGIIGFMIGGEIKLDIFKKYGKSFLTILLCEGSLTFLLVGIAVTLITGKIYLGILLGALASATAPAATVDVIWEYKARGILSTTIFAIVAMDDAFALVLYGFSKVYAKSLMLGQDFSIYHTLAAPIFELGLSLGLGIGLGLLMTLVFKRVHEVREKDHLLAFSISAILINVGLASIFNLDMILSSMAMGMTLININPRRGKLIFEATSKITAPIYVIFFVLVGARLELGLMAKMGLVGAAYLVCRFVGKYAGCYIGAKIAKTDEKIKKYLGLALSSQAGVAIGLAIAIYQSFSKLGPEGEMVGSYVLSVITATTFIVQMIGPPLVKLSLDKAGEIGKNVTEEDILEDYKVKDLMVTNPETIPESASYMNVINILKNSSNVFFPVVDNKNEFHGIIQLDQIRHILFEEDLSSFIMAADMASSNASMITPDATLKTAKEIFEFEEYDYVTVVEDKETKKLIGVVPKRKLRKFIKRKLLETELGELA
jgi:Kef-type K+ transport system membrane component KefB